MSARRVQLEPAYVIHARPYRENSLLVEAMSRHYGRTGLVARAGRKRWRGDLSPFRPLLVSWSGGGELRSLTQVESASTASHLTGRALVTGLYVNELILRLCARDDPHEAVFDGYVELIGSLGGSDFRVGELRRFEFTLLGELGYELALTTDADTGEPLRTDRRYRYQIEHGPIRAEGEGAEIYEGSALLAMAAGRFDGPDVAASARRLTRQVINYYLGERPLKSRELWR